MRESAYVALNVVLAGEENFIQEEIPVEAVAKGVATASAFGFHLFRRQLLLLNIALEAAHLLLDFFSRQQASA